VNDTNTPTRGRPRHFDEETVLDDLTALFWQKGYSQTTVADLVETSGVHKPSLYRTFGTKNELFATILRRYLTNRMDAMESLIESVGPGIEGIHTFLEQLKSNAAPSTNQPGCLLANSSSELCGTTPGFEQFGLEYRNALRQRIRVLINQADAEGTTNDDLVDQRTELFVNFLLGLNVTARGGADDTETGRIIDAMHTTVDTWND
jgi:AcrR family transcriptional regulator